MIATYAYAPFVRRKGREAQRAGYARTSYLPSPLMLKVDRCKSPSFPRRRESSGAAKEGITDGIC